MSGLSEKLTVKLVGLKTVMPLRAKILRPGRPTIESEFSQDFHPQAFHLGAFEGEILRGVATFCPESFEAFPNLKAYRLRGMAVDFNQQGKGIGKAILKFGESELLKKANLLWFNARENAFPFYLSLEYQFYGPMFEIPHIGPHKIMYKKLI